MGQLDDENAATVVRREQNWRVHSLVSCSALRFVRAAQHACLTLAACAILLTTGTRLPRRGVYSVPAFGSEWYWWDLRGNIAQPDAEARAVRAFHNRTYGYDYKYFPAK